MQSNFLGTKLKQDDPGRSLLDSAPLCRENAAQICLLLVHFHGSEVLHLAFLTCWQLLCAWMFVLNAIQEGDVVFAAEGARPVGEIAHYPTLQSLVLSSTKLL